MIERRFYIEWRCTGERDTILLARFRWWHFEIGWPDYDKGNTISSYPLKIYHRRILKGVYHFGTLAKCTNWIIETCKDFALAEPEKAKTY